MGCIRDLSFLSEHGGGFKVPLIFLADFPYCHRRTGIFILPYFRLGFEWISSNSFYRFSEFRPTSFPSFIYRLFSVFQWFSSNYLFLYNLASLFSTGPSLLQAMRNQLRSMASNEMCLSFCFINVNWNADYIGTAMLLRRANDAAGTMQCQIHNHFLDHDKSFDPIALCRAVIVENMKCHAYPYTFLTLKEVLSTIAYVSPTGVKGWDSQPMRCIATENPPCRSPGVWTRSRTTRSRSSRAMTNIWLQVLTSVASMQRLTSAPTF